MSNWACGKRCGSHLLGNQWPHIWCRTHCDAYTSPSGTVSQPSQARVWVRVCAGQEWDADNGAAFSTTWRLAVCWSRLGPRMAYAHVLEALGSFSWTLQDLELKQASTYPTLTMHFSGPSTFFSTWKCGNKREFQGNGPVHLDSSVHQEGAIVGRPVHHFI